MDSVKKYMGLGILLLMTECSVGVSTEPKTNLQEESLVQSMEEGDDPAEEGKKRIPVR